MDLNDGPGRDDSSSAWAAGRRVERGDRSMSATSGEGGRNRRYLGMGIGAALGAALDNIRLGVALGPAIGAVPGIAWSRRRKGYRG